jgi:hypothetical protein
MIRPIVQKIARRYPKYLRKDIILEAELYIKCYKGNRDALPYMLGLHVAKIASELRDIAMTKDLDYVLKNKGFDCMYEDIPSISVIMHEWKCSPRTAYALRNAFQIILSKDQYLP